MTERGAVEHGRSRSAALSLTLTAAARFPLVSKSQPIQACPHAQTHAHNTPYYPFPHLPPFPSDAFVGMLWKGISGKSAFEMLGFVVVLLWTVVSVECYAVHDINERLAHGRQLKIYLPKNSERLEFSPADQPASISLYWEKGRHRPSKGSVSGSGNDRRWTLDKVTYADQGTYIQKDYWNKEVSTVKVAVTPRHVYVKHIAGESLYVSLEGINLADASLNFSGDNINVTLVRDGATVSQDIAEYWDRVRPKHNNIEILRVNTSDVGRYTLSDRRDRVVSITRMDLTDHHDLADGNPLLALLLLLGIPAGICCCCRKKIFKQKASSATTIQATPETPHPPAGGPAGPPPSYHPGPGEPTVFYHGPNTGPAVHPPPSGGQWNGPPPSPGTNPAYPPANPMYPPANPMYPPAGPVYPPGPGYMPPAQPTQWNAVAPGPYPPGPTPMGYAPAMYSAPPGAAVDSAPEETKITQSSPTAPLLGPQVDPAPVLPTPSSDDQRNDDSGYKFHVDGGKNTSTNFL